MKLFIVLTAVLLNIVACSQNKTSMSVDSPQSTASATDVQNQSSSQVVQDPRCNPGQVYSKRGCLDSCGGDHVIYDNQCTPIDMVPDAPDGSVNTPAVCRGECYSDETMTFQGCLPQSSCGTCYGKKNDMCYVGVSAHEYYGN